MRSTKAGGVPPANLSPLRRTARGCNALNEGRRRTSGEPSFLVLAAYAPRSTLNEGRRRTSGEPAMMPPVVVCATAAQRRPEAYLRRTPTPSLSRATKLAALNEGRRRTSGEPLQGMSSNWRQQTALNEGRRRTSGEPWPASTSPFPSRPRSTKAGGVPPANLDQMFLVPVVLPPLNEGRRRTSGEPSPRRWSMATKLSLNEGRRRTSGEPLLGIRLALMTTPLNEGRRRTSGEPAKRFSTPTMYRTLNEGRRRTSGEPQRRHNERVRNQHRSTKAGGVPPANPLSTTQRGATR